MKASKNWKEIQIYLPNMFAVWKTERVAKELTILKPFACLFKHNPHIV